MSLQLAAQHMASRGRGPDTQLVHMAPQEVAGLQALAKAHGGSLTTNPDTGLPEAGFLSSILPMVAGAFLGPAGLGLTALQSGLAAGALGTLATGSLSKGLMAGLGAYGGAGLAGGLMGAGTGALSSAAGSTAANSVVPAVATEAAAPVLTEGVAGAAQTMAPDILGGSAEQLASAYGYPTAVASPVPAINAGQMVSQATPTITQAPVLSQQAADIGNIYAQEQAAQNAVAKQLATATPMNTAKAGLDEIFKDPKRFLTKDNLMYAGAAAAPFLFQEPEQKARKEEKPYEYSFNYNRVEDPSAGYTGPYTGERTYFNPVYTRTAADGGLMDGGPVQSMSDQNQAEMLMINRGQRYAEGGETKAVKPVEENPYYTMTGQSGDAFKYLMGQMPTAPKASMPAIASAPAAAPAPAAPIVYEDRPGGSWVDDTSGDTKPYTFDPSTGAFTAAPVTKVWRPFTTYEPSYGGIGYGGGDTGYGSVGPDTSSSSASYGSDHAAANSSDFGGYMAQGGLAALARGGQSHLGDYSDGGRLLRGPGDGVSDSIPASIGNKRPARLADGEFVVPARIVSELGNGSTEAGARKLYAMMDRVQKARKKSIGKNRVAVNSRAEKLLPA
jgi:hypothetical protein